MFEPIFTFALVAIIETVFSASWNPTYFRFGIPIYRKNYSFEGAAPFKINEKILNEAFKKVVSPSLVFRQIDYREFAFREKILQFTLLNYTPIMHGKLEINEMSRNISVCGYINWWIIAFVITGFIFFPGDFTFAPFMFLLIGGIYLFQKRKYDKVGQFVYEWNSRDWSEP